MNKNPLPVNITMFNNPNPNIVGWAMHCDKCKNPFKSSFDIVKIKPTNCTKCGKKFVSIAVYDSATYPSHYLLQR